MFGIICAGRAMEITTQIEATKYMLGVETASNVHHIVVFLLPNSRLDENVAASVYFQLPGKEFRLLGAVSNDKPSAIFKINNNAFKTAGAYKPDEMVDIDVDDDSNKTQQKFSINIGISLEPMSAVEEAMAAQKQASIGNKHQKAGGQGLARSHGLSNKAVTGLSVKIYQHAYNFMSGFTNQEGMIPLKVFDDWWNKFKSRLQHNPRFLAD